MEKIRFAVCGTGWRSLFYVRAAKLLPERFELTGVLCRTKDRARKYAGEHGVKTFHTLDALLETEPEFVVSCVSKAGMAQMVMELLRRGMPTLSETPYAIEREVLRELLAVQKETGTLLDVAEQYFLFPMHQARRALIGRGLLGDVHSCWLSMMHDYHGASILRWYLGEENGPVALRARQKKTPIIVTGGRGGYVTDGEEGEEIRTYAHFDYADGRLGAYDFSGTQYHSAIRSNHVRILGTRGEIFDDEVRYLTDENRPITERLIAHRDMLTGTIASVSLAGETVYRNPFPASLPMNEDEIAVCHVLVRMGDAVRGGARHYPLVWGAADCALSMAMHEAAQTGETVIC